VTKNQLRKFLSDHDLKQSFVAWLGGVSERHGRAWLLGEYPVPQYLELLVKAVDEGLISMDWLERNIKKTRP
jgi:hypothetical protein